ncbi:hypothetical protein NKJ64_27470 [Mesorhizobium sp. M0062]|uniref:hypothetical protein n=1 Tax=Mesorhizobium sp. M0062 TaxID=2956867 RepID=UPI00333ACC5E
MYGTTLRVFDPGIGGWHIIWSDPLNQDYSRQIGRAEGKDIVQMGADSRGLQARWRFTEITADSFHWIGEERRAESDPWRVTYEHFARRAVSEARLRVPPSCPCATLDHFPNRRDNPRPGRRPRREHEGGGPAACPARERQQRAYRRLSERRKLTPPLS